MRMSGRGPDANTIEFTASYGINERMAGPAGIKMPKFSTVPEPTSIFFFGCATYFIAPDWDHERVYNAGASPDWVDHQSSQQTARSSWFW